jgi:hypothetical protein
LESATLEGFQIAVPIIITLSGVYYAYTEFNKVRRNVAGLIGYLIFAEKSVVTLHGFVCFLVYIHKYQVLVTFNSGFQQFASDEPGHPPHHHHHQQQQQQQHHHSMVSSEADAVL